MTRPASDAANRQEWCNVGEIGRPCEHGVYSPHLVIEDRPAATVADKRDEAEVYLDWFRHQANPRTLAEANVIADELATLLEEVLEATS